MTDQPQLGRKRGGREVMITQITIREAAEHTPMQRKYIQMLERQTCGRLSAYQVALDIIGQQERKLTRLQKAAEAKAAETTEANTCQDYENPCWPFPCDPEDKT